MAGERDGSAAAKVAGTVVLIGIAGSLLKTFATKPAPQGKTGAASWGFNTGNSYDIQKGDTLWDISGKYGITVDELKEANGLFDDLIFAGEKLYVPK